VAPAQKKLQKSEWIDKTPSKNTNVEE